MKTLANLLIVLVSVAGIAFGQTEKPITTWISLDGPSDEFSLEAPEGFEFRKANFYMNKLDERGSFQSSGEWFFIFIDTQKDPRQRRFAEAFLNLSKQTVSGFDLGGNEAQKAEFEDPTGFYHRIVFTQSAKRVFTLHTVSRHKNSNDAVRFLNSFKLNPKAVADAPISEPIFAAADPKSDAKLALEMTNTPPVTSPPAGSGSGQGSGIGTGSGYGSAKASPAHGSAPSTTLRDITPLRILSKAKAQYTDFARFYAIRGTVTLRVTFLAKGEIGSITTIRSLPFGLTESAIYAAKQMRFEPEVANGVVRTTTRPVSFTFDIF